MKALTLGYSPCPNDTFIFYGLVHGKVDAGDLRFKETLLDVETLNRRALKGEMDITKVSYHAYGALRDEYCLLRSGGAMGRGCGPLVVAKENYSMRDLRGGKIAIPGRLTTAYLLLQLYEPFFKENAVVMLFSDIMDAVKKGTVDAGLIIHESRFTYPRYGLRLIADLGEWWEAETGLPIPLGCIIAKKTLGSELIKRIDASVKESVLYAMNHRDEPMGYIKEHSQELQDAVILEHINLYVNDFSADMGEEGVRAVEKLFGMAEERGMIKKPSSPLFI